MMIEWSSSLQIRCNSEDQAEAVLGWLKAYDDDTLFTAASYTCPNGTAYVNLNELGDVYDYDLEGAFPKLAKKLHDIFGLKLEGDWTEFYDFSSTMYQVNDRFEVESADLSWLGDYTVDEVNELKKYAEEHFGH